MTTGPSVVPHSGPSPGESRRGLTFAALLPDYLFTPDRLSEAAFDALGNAENSDGLVISAATLGDLWYSSHKIGQRALTPGAFESLHATVLDPENEGFEVAVIDATTMARLMSFPLTVLPDPWDRMIVATAAPGRAPGDRGPGDHRRWCRRDDLVTDVELP